MGFFLINKKQNLHGLNYLIFLNNTRGLEILKIFNKYKINFDTIITKKNLNKEILKPIKRLKIDYTLVKNCKNLDKKLKKKYDIFILAGFPHIFGKKNIQLPKIGLINLHAGPIPKYMGGSPLNWQIINNEKRIGISIIKVNRKIDGGKLLVKKFFNLRKTQNILHAHKKANNLFKKYIFFSIYNLINKRFLKKRGNQNYYKQRSASDSKVDLKNMTARYVVNLARSQYPLYTPAFTEINKNKVFFKKAFLEKKNQNKRYKYLLKCKRNYIGIKKQDIL